MTTVADVLHRAADSAADAYPAEAFIERHGAALYRGVRRRRVRRTVTQSTVSVAAAGAAVWGVSSLPSMNPLVTPAGVVCTTATPRPADIDSWEISHLWPVDELPLVDSRNLTFQILVDQTNSIDPYFFIPVYVDDDGSIHTSVGVMSLTLGPDLTIDSVETTVEDTSVVITNDPTSMYHRIDLRGSVLSLEAPIVLTIPVATSETETVDVTVTVTTSWEPEVVTCVAPPSTDPTPVPVLTPVPAPSAHEEYTTTQGIHIFGTGPEPGFLVDYVIDPQSTVGATVDPGLVGSVMVSVDDDHTVTRVELLSVGGDPVPEASWYYAGDASGLVIYVDSSLVPYLAEPLTFGEASALQGTRELNLGPLVIVPIGEER